MFESYESILEKVGKIICLGATNSTDSINFKVL